MKRIIVFIGMTILFLVACQAETTQAPGVNSQATETIPNVETIVPSPTPEPTPTQSQPGILLLHPPETDSDIVAELQILLEEQAKQSGYLFQSASSLDELDISQDVKGILVYSVDPGSTELARSFPDIPILLIDVPGASAGGNIRVLDLGQNGADQAGFLAGYLAAVITPDWRAGIISNAETLAGKAASLGFTNGVIYYCGLCRPAYPPFVSYPLTVNIPANPNEADLQGAVDTLVNASVAVVFIPREIENDLLYRKLAEAGILVIGTGQPQPGLENQWVASIEPDIIAVLEQTGLSWLTGEGVSQADVPYRFTRANSELFSPGRQNLVKILQEELQNGFVDTGVDPATGDPRP